MFYGYYRFVPGYFNFESIYQKAIEHCENGDILVEVGSYFGRSACYMIELINHFNKDVKFYAVDPLIIVENDENHDNGLGTGTPWDEPLKDWAERIGEDALYRAFNWNIQCCPGSKKFGGLIRKPSVEAAKDFKDNSLAFCFLDAGHSYKNFSDDFNAWYPKVQKLGFIAGHDIRSDVAKALFDLTASFKPEIHIHNDSWIFQKQ